MTIYAAQSGPYTKIGYTSGSAHARLRSARTFNPEPIDLIFAAVGGRDVEHRLHEYFAEFRIRGEWFDLTSRFDDPPERIVAAAHEGVLRGRCADLLPNPGWGSWITIDEVGR